MVFWPGFCDAYERVARPTQILTKSFSNPAAVYISRFINMLDLKVNLVETTPISQRQISRFIAAAELVSNYFCIIILLCRRVRVFAY